MESGAGVGSRGRLPGQGSWCHVLAATAGALVVLLGAPAARADFYRWVDKNGVEHYSNVPTQLPGDRSVDRVPMEPVSEGVDGARVARPTAPASEAGDEETGGQPAASEGGARGGRTGVQATLARGAMRKEYRKITKRIKEIDEELEALTGARTRWAEGGNPSIGDARTEGAAETVSEEEEALRKERSDLEAQAKDIKHSMAELGSP